MSKIIARFHATDKVEERVFNVIQHEARQLEEV